MIQPLFERTELIRIGRILGALLVLFGGLALLLQAYLIDFLPPRDGFIETSATIIDLEQLGTFKNPRFLVTLSYEIPDENGNIVEHERILKWYGVLRQPDLDNL